MLPRDKTREGFSLTIETVFLPILFYTILRFCNKKHRLYTNHYGSIAYVIYTRNIPLVRGFAGMIGCIDTQRVDYIILILEIIQE